MLKLHNRCKFKINHFIHYGAQRITQGIDLGRWIARQMNDKVDEWLGRRMNEADIVPRTTSSRGQHVPRDKMFMGTKCSWWKNVPKNKCSKEQMFTRSKCFLGQKVPGDFPWDNMFPGQTVHRDQMFPWTKCSRDNVFPGHNVPKDKMFLGEYVPEYNMFLGTKYSQG